MPLHALVIDDEPALRQIHATMLARAGHVVDTATGAAEAAMKLARGEIDVALCDIKMPDGDGIDVLRKARAGGCEAAFVMVTAMASMESAVEALRAGAHDYLVKPVREAELLHRLGQIEAERGLREENRVLRRAVRQNAVPVFQFQSPGMRHVDHLLAKVAPTSSTVLIVGESGTGKGLAARAIHDQSPRADRPKPGMIEVADRGTLFLDEIGELPQALQAKLLRALQERQIRRVGATKFTNVDVRLVSATNRDIAERVRKAEFRDDLFYRVNVITITLPPLRDRAGDVALLAHHFLRRYGRNRDRPLEGIDPEALTRLEAHAWPGNVRELQNVIERACALTDGPTIRMRDLPDHVRGRGRPAPEIPGKDLPLAQAREAWLQAFAQGYLTDLLRRHGGNISQAAKTAGVDRKTLHRLLSKHGIRA